jgi:hypothetical protein
VLKVGDANAKQGKRKNDFRFHFGASLRYKPESSGKSLRSSSFFAPFAREPARKAIWPAQRGDRDASQASAKLARFLFGTKSTPKKTI